jgi:hypothetical protein
VAISIKARYLLTQLFAACLLAHLAVAKAEGGIESKEVGSVHVDYAVTADLTGKWNYYRVEFYRRGPIAQSNPVGPPVYFRGIRIEKPSDSQVGLWEAPTTIPVFYRKWSNVWRTPNGEAIITTAVQFGGRTVGLYAFRWSADELQVLSDWNGENFAIKLLDGNLTVTVDPTDYTQCQRRSKSTSSRRSKNASL